MNLSKRNKEILLTDLDFILKKMEIANTISEAVYYFSGVDGVFLRVLNINYDEELLFIYVTTKTIHDMLLFRHNALKAGETTIVFLDDFKDRFLSCLKDLRDSIEKGENTMKALQKFMALSYSTTGNGYFLLQKGELSI